MKKRSLLMILALALSLTLAIGGTLAYLQDTDADVNVMTLGSVYIVQNEQERDESGALVEFRQNKPAFPAVGTVDWAEKGVEFNGKEYKVFSDDLKNVIDKFVTVTNTGKSDAYVRTIVAIEAPDGDPKGLIHLNYNGTDFEIAGPYDFTDNGVYYSAFVFTYKNVLKAGETTEPSMLQLFLDSKATNEDVAKFGDTWEVRVLSQAVQTAGFDTAAEALEAAFPMGENKESIAVWMGTGEGNMIDGNIGSPNGKLPEGNIDNNPPKKPNGDDDSVTFEAPADAFEVANSEQLKAALLNKEPVILLKDGEYNWSGTGHTGTAQTVSIYGESENAVLYAVDEGGEHGDSDFDGYTVAFNNLTIRTDKATYSGWKRMNATYNNCVIENEYCLYSDSEFNYCTLNTSGNIYNIRTWGAPTATFTNCTFNSDGKAMLLYGTANTKLTLTNCVFNDNGGLTDLKAAVEIGNDYGKSYELIVNNVDVNGYEINDKGINTGTTLWANKDSMGTDKLNVVIDGVDVY